MGPLSSHALTGRWFLTIQQAARMLDSGCINASQLSSFCHSMAVAGENIWGLNAFSRLVDKNSLMERAKESDDRREMGEPLSILDGIPVSIKSNIAEKFSPLTAGSKILGHCENHPPPCGYDADTVRILLREKGAIYMGATSMDEFGMGSLGTNVPKGVCPAKNPLPLKKQLHRLWDEEFGEEKDDETMAEIIHLSPQKITEVHQQALESLKEEETDHYSAGGSSSGSAVSVAHGSSLLSLGTDTGGSVRLPAAWCGLVGLKPSYGLLSRHGVVSYASSFDTVGILSNSVGCAATALDAMAQRDIDYSRDSTFSAYNSEEHDLAEVGVAQTLVMDKPLSGIKVGIPSAFSVEECPKDILEAWSKTAERLEDKGAQIVQISTEQITPKLVQTALSAYYILVSAEASSNLSRYDGFRYGVAAQGVLENPPQDDLTPLEQQYSASRAQGFGPEVIKRILCGAFVLSSDNFHTHYEGAAKLRAALAEELSSVLKNDADLLLFPTVLSSAPKLTENLLNPTAIFANDVMTVPASLAGLPAVSVPVPGENKEFLAGMQLVSSRLQEATLLKAASVIQ